jgi:hypothetical protein
MSGPDPGERRRRVLLAQGLAALSCFFAAHAAHAATPSRGLAAKVESRAQVAADFSKRGVGGQPSLGLSVEINQRGLNR